SFTFQVQDDGGTANGGVDLDQSPNTLAVDLTWTNDTPQGTNNTASAIEDHSYTFATADLGFSDPTDAPASDSLLAGKVTTLPGAGSLANNSIAATAGQFVSVSYIGSRRPQFTTLSTYTTLFRSSFTFQVQDDGGTANGGVDLDQSPN